MHCGSATIQETDSRLRAHSLDIDAWESRKEGLCKDIARVVQENLEDFEGLKQFRTEWEDSARTNAECRRLRDGIADLFRMWQANAARCFKDYNDYRCVTCLASVDPAIKLHESMNECVDIIARFEIAASTPSSEELSRLASQPPA